MTRKIIQDVLIKKQERKKEDILPKKETKSFPKKTFLISFVLIVFIILGGISLIKFSSATIKITPNQEFIDIDADLRAVRNSNGDNLGFEITQLDDEESQTASATGASKDGQKAKGRIIIYNTYSSQSQSLIAQTRFEAPGGKIYRIQDPVTVPGNGSIEVNVYADKPGPEYNIGLADFTIPGFKGTSKYDKIYGRSKTEIKGGATGNVVVVTLSDLNNARNNLKGKIENYLRENIRKQKPDNYLFYDDALKIDFFDDADNPSAGDTANSANNFTFKEKGRAVGFLLKNDDLSRALAERYITESRRNKVKVIDLGQLDFKLSLSNSDNTEVSFHLKGKAHFIWEVDESSLVKDLMNVEGKNYNSVFAQYSSIEKAEIIFRPFWWNFMPSDRSDIYVKTIYKTK